MKSPYLSTIITTFKYKQAYRLDVILKMFGALLLIVASREAWLAIYNAGSPFVQSTNVSTESMLTYAMLSVILLFLFGETLSWDISARVSSGDIILDLQKPINFQLYHLSRDIAQTLSQFVYVIVPIGFIIILLFPIQIPSSINILAFVISLVFAIIISFALSFLVAMLSFLFTEIWGFIFMMRTITQICSGSFIPLWFFSGKFAQLLSLLPFRGIYSIPLSIYIGKSTGENIFWELLFQIGWAFFLIIIGQVMLRIFSRQLILTGG